jgi:hypothetical protein
MLVNLSTRRNSYAPSATRSPLPDSDSEFDSWVGMTDSGDEAGD